MAVKKKRRTVASKKMIKKIRAANEAKKNTSSYKKKKTIIPGPWTNLETKLKVKAKMRLNKSILGETYGTYPKIEHWNEPGWYPIIFNLIAKTMKRDVDKHGLDAFIAACEKELNSEANQKKYGTIIILEVTVNHADREEADARFMSVRAKTNKKSISGFSAIRKGIYKVLE